MSHLTTLTGTSTRLDVLDSLNYYDMTLEGSGESLVAHKKILSSSESGDSLTAVGDNLTLVAGSGADSLTSVGENNVLVVGTGAGTLTSSWYGAEFDIVAPVKPGVSSIAGGEGVDTLAIRIPGRIGDTLFGQMSGLDVLSLTGSSAVTLGEAAAAAGFTTVFGGAGNTRFNVASQTILGPLFINGDTGSVNTLQVGSSATLFDGDFSRLAGINVLSLSDSSAIDLGASAQLAGVSTVLGSDSDSTLVQTPEYTGPLMISGGKGSDLIAVTSQEQLDADTIFGGGGTGTDTLAIVGPSTLTDDDFANVKGFGGSGVGLGRTIRHGVLSLAGGSSLTFGPRFSFASVLGGSVSNTLVQSADHIGMIYLNSGDGDDLISVASTKFLSSDTIVGGDGVDTLQLGPDQVLNDESALKNVTGVEVLAMQGSSSLTLGAAAAAAGVATVLGGEGTATIVQPATSSSSFTIDGGSGAELITLAKSDFLAADSIVGGSGGVSTIVIASPATLTDDSFAQIQNIGVLKLSGASDIVLDNFANEAGIATVLGGSGNSHYSLLSGSPMLVAGAGNDLVSIQDAAQLAGGSILGGAGKNTLQVLGDAELSDDAFANVQGMSVLSLSGSSSVVLDGAALASGIRTVAAGEVSSTLTQGAGFTSTLRMTGGGGDDLLVVDSADLLLKDTINGGDGSDTLAIANEGAITNAMLAKVRGMEVLRLSGSSSATLSVYALKDGLQTVVGGDGDSTILQSAEANIPLYIDGSNSSSNLVGISNQALLTNDTVLGGAGTDTLYLSSNGKLADEAFANVVGFEALSLSGASAITLGDNAAAAGIVTVLGGAGSNTFVQTSGALNISAQSGNDLFVLNNPDIIAADTFSGGGGANTLLVSSEAAISDEVFTNVTSIQALALSGASAITLGSAAAAAGITLVAAGSGDSTLAQMADDSSATKFIGGDGSDIIILENADLLGADTIIGGKGANTLSIGGDTELSDDAFKNLQQIGVLSLSGTTAVTLGSSAGAAGIGTLIGGDGDSNYVQTSGHGLLAAGAGNDVVSVLSNKMLAADTLSGGDGVNTLVIATKARIGDSDFANATGFSVLSLTGSSSVTLGSAAGAAGLTSVFGGAGSNTLLHSASDDNALYLDGAANADGGNLFVVDTADLVASDTFTGAGADKADTLQINGDSTVDEGTLANIQGIAALKLNGASSANLEAVGVAGFHTVFGGDGAGTYTEEAGADGLLLKAGASGDIISVADSVFLSGQTLDGGLGNDSLVINQDGIEVADETFANLSNIESVSIAGGAQVTLDSAALAAGVTSVLLGDGDGTFTQLENDTLALSLISGAGNDLFSIAKGNQLSGDFLSAGDGVDTLQLMEAGSKVVDRNFSRITGFEVLSLAGNTSVQLGEKASEAFSGDNGSTVIAGSGSATIDAAKYAYGLFVDASANADGGDLIGLGAMSGTIIMGSADAVATSTLRGGVGMDTLVIATDGSVTNASLAKVRGLEVLQLTGSSSAELGSNALKDGLQTVVGGLGDSTILQGAGANLPLYVDGSAASSNLVGVYNQALLTNDTVVGGVGVDTLMITSSGKLSDDAFAGVRGFEVISLSGSTSVTLGDNATAAGFQTVLGGSGKSVLRQSGGAFVLDVSASSTALLTVDSPEMLLGDTVIGSSGIDTLTIVGEGELTDDHFANVTGIEIIKAVGSTAMTLGENAAANGLTTVILGNGDTSVVQTAGSLSLVGGDGSDLFTVGSGDLVSGDTIDGGSGTNTLAISSEVNLDDTAFGNLSQIGLLSLTGTSSLTLGAASRKAGLATVVGGDGDGTYSLSAGKLTLVAGAGNDLVSVETARLLRSDSIVAGEGVDTLQVAAETPRITDGSFSQVAGFEVLSLAGNTTVELGATASTAFYGETGATVVAGSTGVTVNAAQFDNALVVDVSANADGGDRITLGSSGSAILVASPSAIASSVLVGGDGTDTLAVAGADEGVYDDTIFGNVSGVEVLSLGNGDNALTLSGDFLKSGISTIVGGFGNTTLQINRQEGSPLAFDGSRSSSNLAILAYPNNFSDDTLMGGLGTDTLIFRSAGEIDDEAFAGIRNFDLLSLEGGSSVVLGSNMFLGGLTSVVAGSGSTIMQGDGMASDMTVSLSGKGNVVSLGSGFDRIEAQRSVSGQIIDGGYGFDTLVMGTPISGADFSGVSNVEVLILAEGNNIIDVSGLSGKGLQTVIGGGGDDSFSGFGNSELDIQGGDGSDTLFLGSDPGFYSDFSGLSGVEVLSLGAADTIDLDRAAAAGISQIVGLSRGLVPTFLASDPGSLSLLGEGLTYNLYLTDGVTGDFEYALLNGIRAVSLTGSDAIDLAAWKSASPGLSSVFGGNGDSSYTLGAIGDVFLKAGSGMDTLTLLEPLTDLIGFEMISGIEVLSLGGDYNQVDLDYIKSTNSSLATVLGGYGNDQFTTSNLGPVYVQGGEGEDTLALTQPIDQNADFTKVSGVEGLSLAGGDNINLDNVANAGICQVIGGSDSSTFKASPEALMMTTVMGGEGFEDALSLTGSIQDPYAMPIFTGIEILSLTGSNTVDLSYVKYGYDEALYSVSGGNGASSYTLGAFGDIYLQAGTGIDTLALNQGVEGPESLSNFTGIEVLSLSNDSNLVDLDYVKSTDSALSTVFGGYGNDQFITSTLGPVYVQGGDGEDTLALTQPIDQNADFTKVSEVEVLSLAGGDNVNLDNAVNAGINRVITGGEPTRLTVSYLGEVPEIYGTGMDTLVLGNGGQEITADNLSGAHGIGVLSLTGSNYADLASVREITPELSTVIGGNGASSYRTNVGDGLYLQAGTGIDTLALNQGVEGPEALSNLTGIEVLSLGGDYNQVDLDYVKGTDSALSEVFGGYGNDQFTTSNLGPVYVQGGEGEDTLALTQPIDQNADFTKVSGVEVLSLAGGDNINLDNVANAGIYRVFTGGDASRLTESYLGEVPEIYGTGMDTLVLGNGGQEITADNLSGVHGIGVLSLTGSNYADLASVRENTPELSTVIGGNGVSSYRTNVGDGLYLQAGTGIDTLALNQGVEGPEALSNFTGIEVLSLGGDYNQVDLDYVKGTDSALSTVFGGYGNDQFTTSNLGPVYVQGGEGDDTLALTQPIDQNADFTKVSGVEVLSLAGGDLVNLDNVANAGIYQVIGGYESSTFKSSPEALMMTTVMGGEGFEDALSLTGSIQDPYAMPIFTGIEILSLTGSNTVDLSYVKYGYDEALYSVSGGNGASSYTLGAFSDIYLQAGTGIDTLVLNQGVENPEGLSSFSGIEVLSLSNDSNFVDLDFVKSTDAALSSVFGGAGENVFTTSTMGQVYVQGGEGLDTLSLNQPIDQNADFTKVSGVEVLAVAGGSNIDLDNAANAGITSVFGGGDGSVLTESFLGEVPVIYGGGNDTLVLRNGSQQITAENLLGVQGISALSLTGSNAVDLTALQEVTPGLSTVIGGDGNSAYTMGASGQGFLEAGAGVDTLTLSQPLSSYENAGYLFQVTAGYIARDYRATRDNGFVVVTNSGSHDFIGQISLQGVPYDGAGGAGFNYDQTFTADNYLLRAGESVTLSSGDSSDYDSRNLTLQIDGYVSGSAVQETIEAQVFDPQNALSPNDDYYSTDVLGSTVTVTGGQGEAFDFSRISGVEVLQLADGDNTVDLGYLGGTGVQSVLGGAGNDSVVWNASAPIWVDGGEGSDTLYVGDAASVDRAQIAQNVQGFEYLSYSDGRVVDFDNPNGNGDPGDNLFTWDGSGQLTLDGGEGVDTLYVTNEANLSDEAFAYVTGIEVLSLTGSSSVDLGGAAMMSGLTTVLGGDGDIAVHQLAEDASALVIDASYTASALVTIDDPYLLAAEMMANYRPAIIGGEGYDTVRIANEGEFSDDVLATITGIEVLQVSGSSNVTLGDNAVGDGLTSVILGDGDSNLYQTAGAFLIDGSASSSALITVDNSDLLYADTIIGGEGWDTVRIDGDAWVADESFANMMGIEVLQVSASSYLWLGDNAAANGLWQVYLGEGYSTLTQTAGAYFIDGSASSSALITIDNSDLLYADTIIGGYDWDTLSIASEAEVTDEAFAFVTGIEALQVSGSSAVTLGDNAAVDGFSTVILGDGYSTLNQLTGSFAIYGSASASALITVDNADLLSADTIIGGDGYDTVKIINAGEVYDGSFANMVGIEVLQASGSSTVILGDNAAASGLTTIILGDGNSTLAQSVGSYWMDGTAASSAAFSIEQAPLVGQDTIIGGDGIDTLQLGSEVTPGELDLSNVYGVEVLQLADSNNSLDLTGAVSAGIQTVIGGAGNDSFVLGNGSITVQPWSGAASDNKSSDYIVAGSSGASLFLLGDTLGNAYGSGTGAVASITGFKAGTDALQLHDFTGAHAGSSGYSTQAGLVNGEVDILDFSGNRVAALYGSTGSFDLTRDVRYV